MRISDWSSDVCSSDLWFRVVAVAIGVLAWGPAQAQAPGGRVSEVVVQGAQRIDPATVRSYMLIQPGDTVDADRLDRSLKALFATGLFADVTIRRHGDTLVVNVVATIGRASCRERECQYE